MSIFLAQIVLIARNEDVEGWKNILVVVVLAVFWALGGIIKARKNAQSRQKEQSATRPIRRPPAPRSRLTEQLLKEHRPAARVERQSYRPGVQEARTKLAEWRAAARKFAEEAEQAFRAQTAEQLAPEPPQVLPKPGTGIVAAYVSKSPQFAAKPSITPENQPAPGEPEQPPGEYLTELLADYADSDQLRRAILHYEILGRPLSLREPGGSAIGL